jgi:micrococcal nuclease
VNRRSVAIVLLVVTLMVGLWWVRTRPAEPAPPPTSAGSFASAWVIDGDTFDGHRTDGTVVRVRLLGIDAPEVAHDGTPAACGGDAAKAALAALLRDKVVSVATDPVTGTTDQYGRMLAYVSVAGIDDIGLRLVSDGMVEAWHPGSERAPTRYASYVVAQGAARTDGRGSWPTCGTLGR